MKFVDLLTEALRVSLSTRRPVIVPEGGRLLWSWFAELSASRTWHTNGPNPITFGEIAAWAGLMRWPLSSHHVEMIRAMDDAWIGHFYEQQRDRHTADDVKRLPPASDFDVSPSVFDAIFG